VNQKVKLNVLKLAVLIENIKKIISLFKHFRLGPKI